MTMRDLYSNVTEVQAIAPQTITGSNIASSGIDLDEFNSAMVLVHLGDIAEMGASPEGAAKIDVHVEHSDDNSTFTDVELKDVVGPSSVTSGIVASPTGDLTVLQYGYVGDKRYLRVTLEPTGLSSGGPVAVSVAKGNARHGPANA